MHVRMKIYRKMNKSSLISDPSDANIFQVEMSGVFRRWIGEAWTL